ncbi:MAG: response regulator transcription factor [Chloroflexi bacterium]|nr:response regulator transcription factor [Chloroflexota bacterium]
MRVLLVDDHALFRAGLASLLRAWGHQVVGHAENGMEAVSKARELHPDIIFMDINMPVQNGLEATRAIKSELPDVKVVILTVSDGEKDLYEAIKSGAEGYVLKNLREDEFSELMSRVERGDPVISAPLAKKLLSEFAHFGGRKQQDDPDSVVTRREKQVLELVAGGATSKEIARSLYISESTVNFHIKNILSKLHMRNRAQVVAWAIEHGFKPTVFS